MLLITIGKFSSPFYKPKLHPFQAAANTKRFKLKTLFCKLKKTFQLINYLVTVENKYRKIGKKLQKLKLKNKIIMEKLDSSQYIELSIGNQKPLSHSEPNYFISKKK